MQKWKLLSSEMTFDHKWFKVRKDTVQLPNGKVLDDYFVWPKGDIGMVVPITSNGDFILVKQYKHAAGEIIIEFPAGMVDQGESPEVCAMRELSEETCYSAPELILLGKFMGDPSKSLSHLHLFLAKDAMKGYEANSDSNENIEVLVLNYETLKEMIFSGEIYSTDTVAAAFFAFNKLGLM